MDLAKKYPFASPELLAEVKRLREALEMLCQDAKKLRPKFTRLDKSEAQFMAALMMAESALKGE